LRAIATRPPVAIPVLHWYILDEQVAWQRWARSGDSDSAYLWDKSVGRKISRGQQWKIKTEK